LEDRDECDKSTEEIISEDCNNKNKKEFFKKKFLIKKGKKSGYSFTHTSWKKIVKKIIELNDYIYEV
jgi:hypothetical protein